MVTAPSPTPLSDSNLGALLCQVRNELIGRLERELAAHGYEMNFSQYLALKKLAAHGPMSAGELARTINLDAGATTRLLDRLEAKGYLRRQPHEQDRRALRIALTEAGQALWSDIHACGERALAEATRGLAPDEHVRLHAMLSGILATLRGGN
ncbi:transcriptional regulator [Mizugakiibacter sediminis]|uniref:Transcriptional regulator n=1 Tax=Mizugakiibacter sediminis TaxID=1475481 RepID=A0A0K8QKS5_9GAMM|nr:MarR family transcriptional regulator [Mizugakiibacter sediminis]GAP65545.1 transcriptional regulator [Mizugakiibacter sediminis]